MTILVGRKFIIFHQPGAERSASSPWSRSPHDRAQQSASPATWPAAGPAGAPGRGSNYHDQPWKDDTQPRSCWKRIAVEDRAGGLTARELVGSRERRSSKTSAYFLLASEQPQQHYQEATLSKPPRGAAGGHL